MRDPPEFSYCFSELTMDAGGGIAAPPPPVIPLALARTLVKRLLAAGPGCAEGGADLPGDLLGRERVLSSGILMDGVFWVGIGCLPEARFGYRMVPQKFLACNGEFDWSA